MKKKLLPSILLFIGLIIIIGLSIWLGFPCEGFNRIPISFVGYAIGLVLIGVAITICLENKDLL